MLINGSILRVNPHAPSKGNRRKTYSVMAHGGSWSPVKISYANGQSIELSLADIRKDGTIKKAAMKKLAAMKEDNSNDKIA